MRRNLRRYALYTGAWLLMLVGVFSLLAFLLSSAQAFVFALFSGLAGPVSLVARLVVYARRGPVLAAGPAGLWIRTNGGGPAIWIPWEGVERIWKRNRGGMETVLVVKPRYPHLYRGLPGWQTTGNRGLATRINSGFGFAATLTYADRPRSEIMAALLQYSAGRTQIG